MTIKEKMCNCKEPAFVCANLSENKIMYSCAKIQKFPKVFRKYLKSAEATTSKPCNYTLTVELNPESSIESTTPDQHNETYTEEDESQKYKYLINKTKYFIEHKYFLTFQELESICKQMNIPVYDHKKESMYEFCERIIKFCNENLS